jgi:cholesterol oxidase
MRSSAEAGLVPPPPSQRSGRPLRVGAPRVHRLAAADGIELRLTRYQGGSRGPVLLVHCIGVSSLMYAIDTVETNLLECLFAEGFDVWLLDMRLSIELPSLTRQSSFDEVATLDFPAAVARVRRETGARSVQVVAHGVGSQTFSMAMLAGLTGVRAAVCSQVAIHPRPAGLNRIKPYLGMPELLAAAGVQSLGVSLDAEAGPADRMLAAGARLHPMRPREWCDSAVCRRISALYGPLWIHARLNRATHDALPEMFGRVNLRALRHLIRNLRTGHVVREDGGDVYLPHLERMAIPIAFLHGEDNDCLRPESTRRTAEALRERNGEGLYEWHPVPGYGHVDCIIGETAARDVYPIILHHLQSTSD